MRKYKKQFFIAAVLLQVFVLLFMIYGRERLLRTGKTVRLSCRPVDPRSLFSGDYVVLNYKISRLDLDEIKNLDMPDTARSKRGFLTNDTVYIGLEKIDTDDVWEAVSISRDLEKIRGESPVVIRGRVEHGSSRRVRVVYGIESYFVPQFEGLEIEKHMANVEVEVAVAESGESAIKKLFIEDKEVEFY